MSLENTRKVLEGLWDHCLDIGVFAGAGYLAGRAINFCTKWTSLPSFFNQTQIPVLGAVTLTGLFALVDRITYSIFNALNNRQPVHKPVYSALRMSISAILTIETFNACAPYVNLAKLEKKPAVVVLLTAIIIYSQFLICLNSFDSRYDQTLKTDGLRFRSDLF